MNNLSIDRGGFSPPVQRPPDSEEELSQFNQPQSVRHDVHTPEIPSNQEDGELGSVDGQKPNANELLRDRGQQLLQQSLLPTRDGGRRRACLWAPSRSLAYGDGDEGLRFHWRH